MSNNITFSAHVKIRTCHIHLLDVNTSLLKELRQQGPCTWRCRQRIRCINFHEYKDEMRVIRPTAEFSLVVLGGWGVAGPLGAEPGC
jgi:hypothetical protein